MTDVAELKIEQGGRTYELREPTFDEHDFAVCATKPDPEQEGADHAESVYVASNGQAAEEARKELGFLEQRRPREIELKDTFDSHRQDAASHPTELSREADQAIAPSEKDRKTVFWLMLLRYTLIGVTICLIAIYVRASGYSVDLSTNWLSALAYGFPVLILSIVLSKLGDRSSDPDARYRLARLYTRSGLIVLTVWAVATAILFGLDPSAGGSLSGVSLSLAPVPVTAEPTLVDSVRAVITGLFPPSVVGTILLASHVLGDVLISAALGLYCDHVSRRGRRMLHRVSEDYETNTAHSDEQGRRLDAIEGRIAYLAGVLHGFDVGRKAAAAEGRIRVAGHVLAHEASRLSAQNETVKAFRPRA